MDLKHAAAGYRVPSLWPVVAVDAEPWPAFDEAKRRHPCPQLFVARRFWMMLSLSRTRRVPTDRAAIDPELRSYSFVVVMQAAEFRNLDHPAPVWRMHRPRSRCVHR